MKRAILLIVLIFPVVTLVYWVYWGAAHRQVLPVATLESTNGAPVVEKTVADRLTQYGTTARARLKPYFDAQQVPYPPAHLTLVGVKDEKSLEVYASGTNEPLRFIRSYPILAASGHAGPKLREGDKQVPEGIYPVEWLNPNSDYHLSFRVGYPNKFDVEHALAERRTNLGGDIMIHGDAKSVGCLAMGDPASEELFVLAAETGITNITIILTPVDFRKGKTVEMSDKLPAWTDSLYQIIKTNLAALPPHF